jgi:hypothetical protein
MTYDNNFYDIHNLLGHLFAKSKLQKVLTVLSSLDDAEDPTPYDQCFENTELTNDIILVLV